MINFKNSFLRIETSFTQKELNKVVVDYISRTSEVDPSKITIMWESSKEGNMLLEKDSLIDFACKINIFKNEVSETNKHNYKELIVLDVDKVQMRLNMIEMIAEYLNLDDHEYAINIKSYEFEVKEDGLLNCIINYQNN